MSDRVEPWAPGSGVVWRSRPRGDVGYVFACLVVVDEPTMAAVLQPVGSTVMRRVAQRGGPQGRSMLPGTWSGERRKTTWGGPATVRLHPVGEAYSVLRAWDAVRGQFLGWYINLEQPWRRTSVGFDSCDDVLDVVVSDDLAQCSLKDEDELDFAVEVGLLRPEEADRVRGAGTAVIAAVGARAWPFTEEAWERMRPPADSVPIGLPTGGTSRDRSFSFSGGSCTSWVHKQPEFESAPRQPV